MCYLVTGIKAAMSSTAAREYSIFDTEVEAKERAESLLNSGFREVALWKQIATPKVERIITW
jgi:hypothetical protein